jgi:hypothetical protein
MLFMIALFCISILEVTGCATSRSDITVDSPVVTASRTSSSKRFYIRSVKDARIFEQSPRDPSTPSLGFGGASHASKELKYRAVGRKRNGYGKALGDVLLEKGQTVADVVKQHLIAGLKEKGYQVTVEKASKNAIPVDVVIKKFWTWLDIKFIYNPMICDTEIMLTFDDSKPKVITGQTSYFFYWGTDGSWKKIVTESLSKFQQQVKALPL